MDEIEVAVKKFGDIEKSTLFDQFERLTVEIQLNQAMLRRSLSEPGSSVFPGPALVRQPVEQGKRGGSWGFHKVVKKLLRPMFWKNKGKKDDHDKEKVQEPRKDVKSWRRFSKSVRL